MWPVYQGDILGKTIQQISHQPPVPVCSQYTVCKKASSQLSGANSGFHSSPGTLDGAILSQAVGYGQYTCWHVRYPDAVWIPVPGPQLIWWSERDISHFNLPTIIQMGKEHPYKLSVKTGHRKRDAPTTAPRNPNLASHHPFNPTTSSGLASTPSQPLPIRNAAFLLPYVLTSITLNLSSDAHEEGLKICKASTLLRDVARPDFNALILEVKIQALSSTQDTNETATQHCFDALCKDHFPPGYGTPDGSGAFKAVKNWANQFATDTGRRFQKLIESVPTWSEKAQTTPKTVLSGHQKFLDTNVSRQGL
ncbi:hypothetical protein DFH28DRAFT_925615 [Melampsora americana]|nr:hypothetical protein DFH28DRAFT_925615 [Melampsora americana]